MLGPSFLGALRALVFPTPARPFGSPLFLGPFHLRGAFGGCREVDRARPLVPRGAARARLPDTRAPLRLHERPNRAPSPSPAQMRPRTKRAPLGRAPAPPRLHEWPDGGTAPLPGAHASLPPSR
ncbi:hypothetical protein GCM10010249_22520 [Streptomyces roseolilacinus]|uniref:Uncharacterized protein n=1 Tax=Streptomyces roseolilacinus TaxID=66904 RepID=A0A918AYV6_9ACTN|nr:hypothetical protein GCM10010249_22520 [Streptomyces roseolilacinus]